MNICKQLNLTKKNKKRQRGKQYKIKDCSMSIKQICQRQVYQTTLKKRFWKIVMPQIGTLPSMKQKTVKNLRRNESIRNVKMLIMRNFKSRKEKWKSSGKKHKLSMREIENSRNKRHSKRKKELSKIKFLWRSCCNKQRITALKTSLIYHSKWKSYRPKKRSQN